jgi:hypothetical protein
MNEFRVLISAVIVASLLIGCAAEQQGKFDPELFQAGLLLMQQAHPKPALICTSTPWLDGTRTICQ